MLKKLEYEVPNGVVFIEDVGGAPPPEPFTDKQIQWNSSSVAIACTHEQVGTTNFALGPVTAVAPDSAAVFDGWIDTPNRAVMIANVAGEALLTADVPDILTRIRVWTNQAQWPDQVLVGWG